MRRATAVLASLGFIAAASIGIDAYLKLGTQVGTRVVSLRWNQLPIRYFITNRDVPQVSALDLQSTLGRAFAQWTGVEGTGLSSQFVGFTAADPFVRDNASVIGFQARADLDRTLGATTFTINTTTGEIVESDIFLNSTFTWSSATAGVSGRFDVESILVHEVGHLVGLGHSALGETELLDTTRRRVNSKRAVMFPIAFPSGNIEDRTIEADDQAGVLDIYGNTASDRRLGSIAGRVTLNGTGIFGAHVTAFNPSTRAVVGGFSLNDAGDFVITALEPGLYVVRVEPLDDADVGSFFDDDTTVNLNFRPTYANSLVAVPAGGSAGRVEIKVRAK